MREVVQEYLDKLIARDYAQGTLRHMHRTLEAFVCFLETNGTHTWQDMQAHHVRAFQQMFSTHSSETAAHKSSYLRTFLRWARAEKFTREDLSPVLKSIRCRSVGQRVLTREEVAALMLLPDTTTGLGIRDRAILELLYSSGLRREEVVRLEFYDIDWAAGTARVIGKGDKERIVPVGKMALYWIHRYVKDVRGPSHEKHLFLNIQQIRGALKNAGIGDIFKRYAPRFKKAYAFKGRLSPHALRHAAATHMLQNGAGSRVVQEFLGHAQLSTTQIYTHVLVDDLRGVIEKFHPRGKLDAAR